MTLRDKELCLTAKLDVFSPSSYDLGYKSSDSGADATGSAFSIFPSNETEKRTLKVVNRLHHFEVKPSGTEGYRTAEVTLGGVDTTEVSSKTMESKKQKGLYFVGEILDVSGHLGGYNFQWAWASAHAASQYV